MLPVQIPDVLAGGRWWPRDEIDATARGWRVTIREALDDAPRPVAAAIPSSPEGVALFVAATSIPAPVMLLPPDARAWRRDPPIPPGTTVVLPPSLVHLAPAARRLGLSPCLLADRPRGVSAPPFTLLQSPGMVLFTSGTTGLPRPVYRGMAALLDNSAARLSALGLAAGDGLVVGASLAHGNGLNRLLASMLLGGTLGLLGPVDHRLALATLARSEFTFWSATAHFADVLGRCTLTGPAVVPRVCLLSSPVSRAVFDAFLERFGVPLRQNYSSSETSCIAVDGSPAPEVRPGTIGRPLPGLDLCIGDHPDAPLPPETTGRIWVRSPWLMEGYGFPPDLERPRLTAGWWPTRDLGALDAEGRLSLAGRIDDCIRTREGRIVNLFAVANDLRAFGGVRAVEIVPLQGPAGSSFGAVLECDPLTTLAALRRKLSDTLPPWSWPRKMALVAALPRLPNGKADRQACRAALDEGGWS